MDTKLSPFEYIQKILQHQEWNLITLESRFIKDLGVDSLEFLELVIAVETHYAIEFEDEELEGVVTVKDFCELIEGRLPCPM